ncbi:MAG: cytochrome c biogenesis protein ResB, partial [Deltaproteobacteria bacterium]|nr:cytochrome c biogenesis protein ResB [Deltaproteobacteria bacterium]
RIMRDLPPGLVSTLQSFQLFDMYHSVWFLLMMALLAVNLVVCSVNRFPRTWRIFQAARSGEPVRRLEGDAADRIFTAGGPPAREAEGLERIIRRKFGKVRRMEEAGMIMLHGEKGAFSYFGVYVVHLSILVILAGAIIGSLSGFDGYVNIPEGGTVDTVKLRGGQGTKKLDFAVRCDRFTVEFYDNGMPREFRSDLAFLREGKIIQEESLRVNHPIEFGGIRFYQASYGNQPGTALLTVRDGRGVKKLLKVSAGDQFELAGKKAAVSVLRIEENLMNMGPAVKLGVMSEEGGTAFWVFGHIREIEEANPGITKQVPQFNPGLFKPYLFSLGGIESAYYTGLQVSTDPGVPIVAAGAILMVAGFMIVFFFSHRQIWVRVEGRGGKSRISVVGRCSRDPAGLTRDMDALATVERK